MIKCPSCSRDILEDSRLCSSCGSPVEPGAEIPTVTASQKPTAVPPWYRGLTLLSYVFLEVLGRVVVMVVLMRFGLLALAAAFFVSRLFSRFPITLDFSTWYAAGSLLAMLAVIAVAGYAFHTALAGRPLLKDELLEA